MTRLLLILFFPILAHAQGMMWIEGTTVGVPAYGPAQDSLIGSNTETIFVNSYTGAGMSKYPPGVWNNVDLGQLNLPMNVKAVRMDGVIIITHGQAPEDCDLQFWVRSGAAIVEPDEMGQTIVPQIDGGSRSNAGFTTALYNGTFQFKWSASTFAQFPGSTWPNVCSYGINLHAGEYLR